ncbi:MAG: ABC transporter substrate-binding protein [Actinomycetaceae bacterium]|nr:ABC transporter substrate-binding protein [Actinomycetaceae bacterium]
MRKLSTRAVISAFAVVVMSVSACGNSSSSDDKSGGDGSTVTITDQRGKEVKVKSPADKIATTVIPSPFIIAAIDGSWDRVVGVNESSIKAAKEGITGKIFPDAAKTATISGDDFVPNMETILGLEPDVVIQWGDQGDDVIRPIEESGVPVVGLEYGTQEKLEQWITMFGQMVGKEDRAEEIIKTMHTQSQELQDKTKDIETKPRVLQLSYSDSKLGVATGDDYAQHVFDLINAENVAKDATVDDGSVSAEQIIAWDPEVIFLSAFDPATPDDIYSDERFADVSAVKNKRVYRAPLGVYRWQVPCAESPLYWNWAAALVHPEHIDVDLPAMMREQIKFMYNYDLTQEDIDLTLRTDINNGSANYDRVQ